MLRKPAIKTTIFIMLGLILMILYGVFFFQRGILFEGTFLRQIKQGEDTAYQGTVYGESIFIKSGDITNTDSGQIQFQIGDWYDHTFTVNKRYEGYRMDITIYENNQLRFDGYYQEGKNGILFEKNGELADGILSITVNNESPFSGDYRISNYDIIETLLHRNVILRGNPVLLLFAVILTCIHVVDRKWPLFFFTLRNVISVNNPEPSEVYLVIQKFCWHLYPVIIAGLLLAGLFIR